MIARNVTHDICSHCGGVAGAGIHGHTDAPDWRWLRVEYVPADQLAGAVEALREWLAADDDAERDYTPESEARLDAAIRVARAIVGGQ
jgi:hypothetical protein